MLGCILADIYLKQNNFSICCHLTITNFEHLIARKHSFAYIIHIECL